MKIAAVQMVAQMGQVEANMAAAKRLAREAFRAGAEMVILPEFFTSAMGYSPVMKGAARPADGAPFQLLKDLAKAHDGIVGGSFIAADVGECFNRFFLFFPDGSYFVHDKDQPTMWENAYYIGGADDGVLKTPAGRMGAALCWEFVRTRTARRLKGRVNLVVGGSCWWSLPQFALPGYGPGLRRRMHEIMVHTPARFARLLGVPVVHAAHAGDFSGRMPLVPGLEYASYMEGETQITDHGGKVLQRMKREDGEGFILEDLDFSEDHEPLDEIPKGFWIPEIPLRIRAIWAYQNAHGRLAYRFRTKPFSKYRIFSR